MTRWPSPGMPVVPRDGGENVEYAADGTEHSRDENGNLVTKQEQQQRKLVADRMAELHEMSRAQAARFWILARRSSCHLSASQKRSMKSFTMTQCPWPKESAPSFTVMAVCMALYHPMPSPNHIADTLMNLHKDREAQKLSRRAYVDVFYSTITSLRGFAEQFTSLLPASRDIYAFQDLRVVHPPPTRHIEPNPFGLRLSHDGRAIRDASKRSDALPATATQARPWSAWSPIIPHRMMPPSQITVPEDEYIAAIREWTKKEEKARIDHQAAQQAAKEAGQKQEETPFFFNTPPFWPELAPSKYPFNVYLDKARYTEEANAWPKGEVNYAKTKWDAMTKDEQAMYENECEEMRKRYWIASETDETWNKAMRQHRIEMNRREKEGR